MDPSRSERIQELFAAAIEHPAGEREAYVIDSVADLELRAELLSLVKAHEGRGSLDSIAEHLASSASTEHVERLRAALRSEEHTSELQSLRHLVCRLLLEKKKRPRRADERFLHLG